MGFRWARLTTGSGVGHLRRARNLRQLIRARFKLHKLVGERNTILRSVEWEREMAYLRTSPPMNADIESLFLSVVSLIWDATVRRV